MSQEEIWIQGLIEICQLLGEFLNNLINIIRKIKEKACKDGGVHSEEASMSVSENDKEPSDKNVLLEINFTGDAVWFSS